MFQSLKDLFRPSFLFRPRDVHVHPLDDQNNLRNANPAPPTPGRPPGTDAESSNRLSKTFRELAAKLRPSFPQACSWLAPTDLQDIEDNPVDGGRFADVWKGRLQARDIAIKSYRCYVRFDCDQVRMRFLKEAHAYSLLSHRNIVPFLGVYSTTKHPFSLVFDYMEHLSLSEYLRNNPDVQELELVAGIARGLHHMHDLGVVHANLEITNVLVDSEDTPRIAGLGSALVHWQSSPVAWLDDSHELTRSSAPELVTPDAFGLPGPQATEASDIYSFGVLAYQIFAGNRMFPNLADHAAVYLMLDGSRPPRPDNPELSDRVWDMINRCWAHTPSQRIKIADVVSVLEIELQRTR